MRRLVLAALCASLTACILAQTFDFNCVEGFCISTPFRKQPIENDGTDGRIMCGRLCTTTKSCAKFEWTQRLSLCRLFTKDNCSLLGNSQESLLCTSKGLLAHTPIRFQLTNAVTIQPDSNQPLTTLNEQKTSSKTEHREEQTPGSRLMTTKPNPEVDSRKAIAAQNERQAKERFRLPVPFIAALIGVAAMAVFAAIGIAVTWNKRHRSPSALAIHIVSVLTLLIIFLPFLPIAAVVIICWHYRFYEVCRATCLCQSGRKLTDSNDGFDDNHVEESSSGCCLCCCLPDNFEGAVKKNKVTDVNKYYRAKSAKSLQKVEISRKN